MYNMFHRKLKLSRLEYGLYFKGFKKSKGKRNKMSSLERVLGPDIGIITNVSIKRQVV